MALYAKVSDGLFIGNVAAAIDGSIIERLGVSAIVNLGRTLTCEVDTVSHALIGQELLQDELPKTIAKLESITSDIAFMRDCGKVVLVCCNDGINKSPLAVGYYLISAGGAYGEIIRLIESIYGYKEGISATADQHPKCLTLVSFRKILRMRGGSKK